MDFISAAREIIKKFITKTQLIQLYNNILNADNAEDEKISKLLSTVYELHHDEVMKALIKNMTIDVYNDLDEDDHQIIKNFYDRMSVNAEKRRKKEAECHFREDNLPIIGNPTISTEDNSEISIYTWENNRVVSVVKSDDDDGDIIEGKLKTYSDKFAENTVRGNDYREVMVDATSSKLNINLVYLGKGSGICTLGVASVLYAVLDQASMIGWFPSKGHVHIMSFNGCRAFNCYNRAFILNGFELDPDTETNQHDIVHEYANRGYGSDVEDGEFDIDLYYVSKEQKQKEIKYKQDKNGEQHKNGVFHQFVCDSIVHN